MFEERLNQNKHSSNVQRALEEAKARGLSSEAQGEILSKAAEDDITESLFGEMNVTASCLKTEKDYINFAKKVAGVLYKGEAPYRISAFFKELLKDLPKDLDSKRIKEILDIITTIYNEKVREEKDKSGKGKPKKTAQLASGKNTRDQQIISQMIGEDDYGEEYDDEDEDGEGQPKKGKGNQKFQEDDYDFM